MNQSKDRAQPQRVEDHEKYGAFLEMLKEAIKEQFRITTLTALRLPFILPENGLVFGPPE